MYKKNIFYSISLLLITPFVLLAQKPISKQDKINKLVVQIESSLRKAEKSPLMLIYQQDVDSIEATVNRLNKLDLPLSLKYYPRINELIAKAEEGKAKRQSLFLANRREIAQKEYYTLVSIIEEDEKLNSFDPKDLIDIVDRAYELMAVPENDLTYNENLYRVRGKAYFDINNYYGAILNLKKISQFNKDTVVMKYLALSYFNINKAPESTIYVDKALVLNPNDEDLLYARYQINKASNKEQGMFADLLELNDQNPTNPKYIKLMGDYFFDRREIEKAKTEYTKIIKLDSTYGYGWMLLGNCYLALNNKNDALACFEKSKKLGNQNIDKVLESLYQNYLYVNTESTTLYDKPKSSGTSIIQMNTGFKVRIIEEIDAKWVAVVVENLERYTAVVGYVQRKNLSISIFNIDPAKLNQSVIYTLPEKSPLQIATGKIYYNGDKGECADYVTKTGEKTKLNKECK